MERKTRLNFQGKDLEGIDLDFKIKKEEWNEYELSDGTFIKIKTIASSIVRIPDMYDNDGNPVYLVKSSNVMAVSASENLKKGAERVH